MADDTTASKGIVYLIGAGATHAEVDALGATRLNLLMQDDERLGGEGVATGVLRRLAADGEPFLAGEGLDIEKLISLLVGSGVDSLVSLADKMRAAYFDEIKFRLGEAQIIDRPDLARGLFEMHQNEGFREVERLSGVISTNHDGLLQIASQEVYGAINLGFPFLSDEFVSDEQAAPLLLQLHGSFTWRFGVPTRIERLRADSEYSRDTVWIPPSILKESKAYPFNKLAALAYELLARQCDVLRVVGASLTQNDWNILSLIFNAQRHREITQGAAFTVELVMPERAGERIRRECSYLRNVVPIGFLTEGQFDVYKEADDPPPDSDLNNPFAYWLQEKLEHHNGRGEMTALGPTIGRLLGESV